MGSTQSRVGTMRNQKWIVTGGCGFAGSNLVSSLLSDNIEVVVLDNLSRRGAAENLAWLRTIDAERKGTACLRHIHADVRNEADVQTAFELAGAGVTAVAHLAGQVAMTTSIARPRFDFEVNVLGSLNVLEVVRRHCSDAIVIYSSTNKVYGDLGHLRYVETDTRWTTPDYPDGFDEKLNLDFSTPYGCSKGAADQYFTDYHRVFGLKTVVFRHSSIYGQRQFATFDQGWIGWFCSEALRQAQQTERGEMVEEFTINGDGKQVRDLLHADDFVRFYRRVHDRSEDVAGKTFNIGGGMTRAMSVLELLQLLEKCLGTTLRFRRLPARSADQRVFVADHRKASAALDIVPSVTVEDGIRRMLSWTDRTYKG